MSAIHVWINGLRRNGLHNPRCTELHTHTYIHKIQTRLLHRTQHIFYFNSSCPFTCMLHVSTSIQTYTYTYMHLHQNSRHVTALSGLIWHLLQTCPLLFWGFTYPLRYFGHGGIFPLVWNKLLQFIALSSLLPFLTVQSTAVSSPFNPWVSLQRNGEQSQLP